MQKMQWEQSDMLKNYSNNIDLKSKKNKYIYMEANYESYFTRKLLCA